MTFELEYDLQQFREEQKELFDENGNAYTTVGIHKPAERMLKLINMLESELKLKENGTK